NPVGAVIAKATGIGTIIDTVAATNHPPVASPDSAQVIENIAATIDVMANDSDPDGDKLAVSSFTQGPHGQVTANADGTLTYTPAPNYLGSDSFAYTISDGRGGTATATVSILVVAPITAGTWPAHVFAPYVDMALYPTYNLVTAAQSQGLRYFT